jgi:hypothetical protein
MTEHDPENLEPKVDHETLDQYLALGRLRLAMKPHGTLSRIDEKGRVVIEGAPLDTGVLYWSNRVIEIEAHEWWEEGEEVSCDDAWQRFEDRLGNLPLWEKKGWSLEAYGSDATDDDPSIWMSARYCANDEHDLADALRWLVDEDLRVDTDQLVERARNRIAIEALGWHDWEIDRMSPGRRDYLVRHEVRGDLFTLDIKGNIVPRPGSNVWFIGAPR